MPDPILQTRPGPPKQDGPCLAGMEEVGTGILDHVDAMQRVAASAPPGPILINAGPGTGKSHVLVRRIAYHVKELHIPASQCLVLTSSTSAARHIYAQLTQLLGDETSEMTIATFHDYRDGKPPQLGHLFIDDVHHLPMKLYDALRDDRSHQPAFTATGDPDSCLSTQAGPFSAFARDYPDAWVVRLTRNHRCTAPIIAAAMQLITPITQAPSRNMIPSRSAAGTAPIGRFFADSPADEEEFVGELTTQLTDRGVDSDDIAVLRGGDAETTMKAISSVAGQQFRVVCCLGVTERAFPDTILARRGLFTAMTRARDLLYLCHSDTSSAMLDDIDAGLFTSFGTIVVDKPQAQQPKLL